MTAASPSLPRSSRCWPRPPRRVPEGPGYLYEPKWDGFRAIVFRGGDDIYIQSRELKPLDRYFPELRAALPRGAAGRLRGRRRDRDRDGSRARLRRAAAAHPPGGVADRQARRGHPGVVRGVRPARRRRRGSARRAAARRGGPGSSRLLAGVAPPVHVTPATADVAVARDWLARFEGAGLDGVMAKPDDGTYEPGVRAMIKVKHARTADCVVAGFRWHKTGPGELVGSLLLGLYDERGRLQHVGVTSAFTAARRRELARSLRRCVTGALEGHPWRTWADAGAGGRDARRPEPMERRQGSVVGAAAGRTRLRGELRPHAGRPLPPRGDLPAVAGRQGRRPTAATTSSRSPRPTSWPRSSARVDGRPGRPRPALTPGAPPYPARASPRPRERRPPRWSSRRWPRPSPPLPRPADGSGAAPRAAFRR